MRQTTLIKRYSPTILIWTLSVILSFASCSSDGDSISIIDERVPLETEAPFSIILKAYSENSDITAKGDVKSTTLYVFDENNDFYKQITVDNDYLLQVKPCLLYTICRETCFMDKSFYIVLLQKQLRRN